MVVKDFTVEWRKEYVHQRRGLQGREDLGYMNVEDSLIPWRLRNNLALTGGGGGMSLESTRSRVLIRWCEVDSVERQLMGRRGYTEVQYGLICGIDYIITSILILRRRWISRIFFLNTDCSFSEWSDPSLGLKQDGDRELLLQSLGINAVHECASNRRVSAQPRKTVRKWSSVRQEWFHCQKAKLILCDQADTEYGQIAIGEPMFSFQCCQMLEGDFLVNESFGANVQALRRILRAAACYCVSVDLLIDSMCPQNIWMLSRRIEHSIRKFSLSKFTGEAGQWMKRPLGNQSYRLCNFWAWIHFQSGWLFSSSRALFIVVNIIMRWMFGAFAEWTLELCHYWRLNSR